MGEMNLKILASDYDGTLFFGEEEPNFRERDIKAIQEFQKAGNLFGICTGRPYQGITSFIPESIHLDFYILNSGAVVIDQKGKEILKMAIPLQTFQEMWKIYPDLPYFVMTEDKMYVRELLGDKPSNDRMRIFEKPLDLAGKEILGISFHVDEDEELRKILTTLQQFPTLSVFQNRNDIDCVAAGCSKSTGLKALQQHLNLNDQQVACIGDSHNDLPMLRGIQESFTFHTSPEVVKASAKYLVDDIAMCIQKLLKAS